MDFQALIDKINEDKLNKRKQEMYCLKDLIKSLTKYPEDWQVFIEPFGLIPTGFASYRGYYSDLALDFTTKYDADDFTDIDTVGELLKEAKACIGKTFTGYKGGDFTMDETTPLWVSDYGRVTDMAIEKVESPFEGYVYIYCYKKED